jgi:type 1 glutamine amidotransferase
MKRAVILSGADRNDGPWHDHAATSQRIAEALGDVGFDARIRACHPRAFGDLAAADLVVVNIANGEQGPGDASDEAWAPAWDALRVYVERGGPLIALHLSSAAFREIPEWRQWIGGAWIAGTSMHPPISDAHVAVATDVHPIVAGFTDFDLFDEMYSHLALEPGNTVLATHRYEDRDHPLAWARETASGRVVYDALGHGVRAYDSPERVRLLQREALWVTGGDDGEIAKV